MAVTVTGLRLFGDDRDVVALDALVRLSPGALTARYRVARRSGNVDDAAADVVVLGGDVFDTVVVTRLRDAGVSIVAVDSDDVVIADGLLVAVATRSVVETHAPVEVLFVVDAGRAPATGLLLEQLALLGRHDARVAAFADGRVVVRVAAPPWWLFSRVVDGDVDGVRVLLSSSPSPSTTPSPLYVEHGRRHPLATTLTSALRTASQVGLLWRTGALERVSGAWDERGLDDALRPELPATTTSTTTTTTPLTERFTVRLRLGPADPGSDEPELFVVPASSLPRLQGLVDSASADEIERVHVGRIGDDLGRPAYVVRELVRPGTPRLGARLQTLLATPGYTRSSTTGGLDGLYLPVGRRLLPVVRPAALRELLGLASDDAGVVIVDEDSAGLHLTRVTSLDLSPLSTVTSFALTDRRRVYDRLLEGLVLSWPGVELQRPAREAAVTARRAPVAPPPRPVLERLAPVAPSLVVRHDDTPADRLALQQEEQAHQIAAIAAPDDVEAWTRLTAIKSVLLSDDVVESAAAALFLQATPAPATVMALSSALASASSPALSSSSSSSSSSVLLELVTLDAPDHVSAVRLCVEVLVLLAARDRGEHGVLDDDLLQQATRVLMRDSLPVPRRLQWTTLLALARHNNDAIGLTRAREMVLGALNTRGLTEALDLPRFVRTQLAFAGVDAAVASPVRVHSEQLVVLERGLLRLVPEPLSVGDGTAAVLKTIFASGIARLGGAARPILQAVEAELPAHDGPIQGLLRLYLARIGFSMTRDVVDNDEARALWKQEAQQVLALSRLEDRRAAEWLMKRSSWLRVDVVNDTPPGLRASLARKVADAVAGEDVDVAAVIRDVRSQPGSYDFELAAAVEGLLQVALRSGRDDVIVAATDEAIRAAGGVRILAYRARVLGACVRAAAVVHADSMISRCLDDVAAIASDAQLPSIRDLLLAIRPALLALRRVGASEAARRFILAFVPLTHQVATETGPLAAALAEGAAQLGEHELAEQLLQQALERVWVPSISHIDRYEAGMATLTALAHWPHQARFQHVERFIDRLGAFTDTFTTSRWFPTHQLLIAERIVDCLADDSTVRSDTLQAWLDDDEARVRRRIVTDWRAASATD